jgi:hypothetical protein
VVNRNVFVNRGFGRGFGGGFGGWGYPGFGFGSGLGYGLGWGGWGNGGWGWGGWGNGGWGYGIGYPYVYAPYVSPYAYTSYYPYAYYANTLYPYNTSIYSPVGAGYGNFQYGSSYGYTPFVNGRWW